METTLPVSQKTRKSLAIIKFRHGFETYDKLLQAFIKIERQFKPELKEMKK